MTPLRLAVIIVNYRTPEMTLDCLASLVPEVEAVGGLRVIVVENGSGDDSADRIQQAVEERGWDGWVQLVRSPVNVGFAGGNNVGIRAADADRYLLLNSDTIVRPGAIRSLMRAMDERPDAGLIGPRLEWPDSESQESCFHFRTPISELVIAAGTGPITRLCGWRSAVPVSDEPIEPDWISFACALIRREVFDRVGLLDDGYFLYFDDIDLCRRARQAGWNVLYRPEARVVHLRGGSGPVKNLRKTRRRQPAYLYASRARYFAKFHGRTGLWTANVLWEVGRTISLLRELLGRPPHTCRREPLDIWTHALNPMRKTQPRRSSPA